MEFGNRITAPQATAEGEAVVLGGSGTIPQDLLPETSGGGGGWTNMTGAEFHQFCIETLQSDVDATKAVEFLMTCGGVTTDPPHMVNVQIHGYCINNTVSEYYPRHCDYNAVEIVGSDYWPILAGPALDDELIFSDGDLIWNGVILGHDGNLIGGQTFRKVTTVTCRVVDWLTGGGGARARVAAGRQARGRVAPE